MDFSFYSLSIPVEGFLRTAVYDLQRNDYFFVNNGVRKMIDDAKRTPIINLLLKERAIFEKPKQLQFVPISAEEYDYPSLISNAIIEVDGHKTIGKLLEQLDTVQCYNIQWIYKGESKLLYNFLECIIKRISESSIKYCEIAFCEQDYNNVQQLLTKKRFPELGLIYLHSAKSCEYYAANSERPPVIYFDSELHYTIHQYKKSINFFTINYLLFTESLRYNSYYNRKIFINLNGGVSTGPSDGESFGNLYEEKFEWEDFLKLPKVKVLWELNKDKISVCKNCEYRYMCVDGRIPKMHLNGIEWYHDTECNYNPFVAKWKGEPGYKSLFESGIKVGKDGVSIDFTTLKSVLSELNP